MLLLAFHLFRLLCADCFLSWFSQVNTLSPEAHAEEIAVVAGISNSRVARSDRIECHVERVSRDQDRCICEGVCRKRVIEGAAD